MSVLRIKIKGWEDGEQVERWLDKPDRWQLHSADTVTLVIDDMEVTINQKVGGWQAASDNDGSSLHTPTQQQQQELRFTATVASAAATAAAAVV